MSALIALIALALLALPPGAVEAPDAAAVLREINVLRADPAGYAAELRRIAGGYDGRSYVDSAGSAHASVEGAAAVRDAAAALVTTPPAPALGADPVLAAAARDWVEAQARSGTIGHIGPDGDTPGARVRRRGGDVYVSEVIAYGLNAAADIVRQLVIDDGIAARGHRRLLVSAPFRYAGVWCGPHPVQRTVCVIDLASEPAGRAYVPRD